MTSIVSSAGTVALADPFRWDGDHIRADVPGGHVLFTTRRGGASAGAYASLNLGPWTEDDPSSVAANRARVSAMAGGLPLVGLRQVHGCAVHVSDGDPAHDPAAADAIVTTRADRAVGVLVADCLPIVLVSPAAVAAVHAGWRGLAAGVVTAAVSAVTTGGSQTAISALIGPGVGGCCYEVGDEVRAAFADHADAVDGRRLDLKMIAARVLRDAGVGAVHDVGLCTMCSPAELFYSHRRDKGTTGRQMGVVWRS